MAMGLGSVIILPIMIGIFGFVGAAILFLIWKLTGSQESYETAYRCGAYIGVLTPISVLLHLIPFVGAAASVLLMTFFLVTASVAVHNIPSRKAWLVFGIIGGLLVFFSVSAEFAARRIGRQAAEYQKQAEEASKAMGKQSEEAAKQMQQQMEEAQKAMEQMQKGAPKER
jgi:type VI protein secretion system component VasK